MENNIFGKTNSKVSKLGLGLAQVGFQLGYDGYKEANEILNYSLDNGINFLDTAAMYNDSEAIVGKSVGHRRNEYFLATKAGTGRTNSPDSEWTYKKVKASVEKSLKNLQTDRIDLVQLHSCETHILEQGDVIRALQDCKIEGKAKFIGYSGDNEAAAWAVKSNLFDTLQTSYSIADQRARTKNILSEAANRNLGVIAKRPIGNASLLGVKHNNNNALKFQEVLKSGAYDEYFNRMLLVTKELNIKYISEATKNDKVATRLNVSKDENETGIKTFTFSKENDQASITGALPTLVEILVRHRNDTYTNTVSFLNIETFDLFRKYTEKSAIKNW